MNGEERIGEGRPLVSILGDSLSTYEGYNPTGFSVYYRGEILNQNDLHSVYDTWWAKVNQFLHAYLCVCNAYSGSSVVGRSFPAGQSMQRARGLHSAWGTPDIILVYLGFNDFARHYPVRGDDSQAFEQAYRIMLDNLRANYGNAVVICGTLMQTYIKDLAGWSFPEYERKFSIHEYNRAIRKAAIQQSCLVADLAALGQKYETLDGAHATRKGHIEIAEAWKLCLRGMLEILKLREKQI